MRANRAPSARERDAAVAMAAAVVECAYAPRSLATVARLLRVADALLKPIGNAAVERSGERGRLCRALFRLEERLIEGDFAP